MSAVLTNAPFILNLDCDHYFNNSKAIREAMCFLMDPQLGKKLCYVQFPQRFDGIDHHDRYANRNVVFFDVSVCSILRLWVRIQLNYYVRNSVFELTLMADERVPCIHAYSIKEITNI